MTTTSNLGITFVDPAQAQKEVTINQAFTCLDAFIRGEVEDKDLVTPPASPIAGTVYIVAAGATDAWAGHSNALTYFDQVWNFVTPQTGMRVWMRDESQYYSFDGTNWVVASLGIVTADNYYLGAQGNIMSASLATDFPTDIWPMIWLTTDDDSTGGAGHPVCSITLENTNTTNKFGELSFATRVSGVPTDTWAFAVDPARINTENFMLRHTGQPLIDWSEDNSTMRVYSDFVIDGSVGKTIQSRNGGDTATLNLMRIAGGGLLTMRPCDVGLDGNSVLSGCRRSGTGN